MISAHHLPPHLKVGFLNSKIMFNCFNAVQLPILGIGTRDLDSIQKAARGEIRARSSISCSPPPPPPALSLSLERWSARGDLCPTDCQPGLRGPRDESSELDWAKVKVTEPSPGWARELVRLVVRSARMGQYCVCVGGGGGKGGGGSK